MRILTLTNMYPSPGDPAFGPFVADQVGALRRHPQVTQCEVLFIDGRQHKSRYLRGVLEVHRALRRMRVDVIHAHYGLTGAIGVLQPSVPVVVTYHSGDLELRRWQRQVSRTAYQLATDNICVSRSAMRELPGASHHLTCSVDLTLFTPRDRSRARARFGVAPGELAILFPSAPDRPKKAYPRYALVRDTLEGRGHRVRELHLVGLERSDVPEIMAAADVMVMTSTQEGSPVAVMEALACGLAVVSTPAGDVADILRGAQHAQVMPFEARQFADAVEAMTRRDDRRVRDPRSVDFASERVTDRLVQILADAIATGRRPRRGRSADATWQLASPAAQ